MGLDKIIEDYSMDPESTPFLLKTINKDSKSSHDRPGYMVNNDQDKKTSNSWLSLFKREINLIKTGLVQCGPDEFEIRREAPVSPVFGASCHVHRCVGRR